MIEPRIIIATGKQKTLKRSSNTIATARYVRKRPTIYVWKPRLFTRWVYEHELAHLKDKSKDNGTFIDVYKREVKAERMANKAMGKGDELNDSALYGFMDLYYRDLRKHVPEFASKVKNKKDFVKFGEVTGNFKYIGLTDEEINRYKRLLNKYLDKEVVFDKVYRVTLDVKSGDRKAQRISEIASTSSHQALDLAKNDMPAVDTIWEVVGEKVEKISG